ncbi:uncharacterized protein MONOS_325 [Monocercomonoides exilis]|uniref:uncharacterized protein n=1 Tax=Monocercomonoides exilis TaxID=2049356 RepID=UPI003559D164|nr:hypothetical protein MONOS_325 [Monocercomonoides exilis]|eukprot:MONOS_325.1-p1 / transcript=MONOS_325.1 / gene=MONOS_325 / organism=Monocercomonoides_exilis_PA203 / gene_product=unspecified product / transcript_product=unspecified product / location=Mono_scaffold00005:158382-161358(+) / protein_length=694 / sequence_SO=supercontig / SO=protein_coding / is_pseudo=false
MRNYCIQFDIVRPVVELVKNIKLPPDIYLRAIDAYATLARSSDRCRWLEREQEKADAEQEHSGQMGDETGETNGMSSDDRPSFLSGSAAPSPFPSAALVASTSPIDAAIEEAERTLYEGIPIVVEALVSTDPSDSSFQTFQQGGSMPLSTQICECAATALNRITRDNPRAVKLLVTTQSFPKIFSMLTGPVPEVVEPLIHMMNNIARCSPFYVQKLIEADFLTIASEILHKNNGYLTYAVLRTLDSMGRDPDHAEDILNHPVMMRVLKMLPDVDDEIHEQMLACFRHFCRDSARCLSVFLNLNGIEKICELLSAPSNRVKCATIDTLQQMLVVGHRFDQMLAAEDDAVTSSHSFSSSTTSQSSSSSSSFPSSSSSSTSAFPSSTFPSSTLSSFDSMAPSSDGSSNGLRANAMGIVDPKQLQKSSGNIVIDRMVRCEADTTLGMLVNHEDDKVRELAEDIMDQWFNIADEPADWMDSDAKEGADRFVYEDSERQRAALFRSDGGMLSDEGSLSSAEQVVTSATSLLHPYFSLDTPLSASVSNSSGSNPSISSSSSSSSNSSSLFTSPHDSFNISAPFASSSSSSSSSSSLMSSPSSVSPPPSIPFQLSSSTPPTPPPPSKPPPAPRLPTIGLPQPLSAQFSLSPAASIFPFTDAPPPPVQASNSPSPVSSFPPLKPPSILMSAIDQPQGSMKKM